MNQIPVQLFFQKTAGLELRIEVNRSNFTYHVSDPQYLLQEHLFQTRVDNLTCLDYYYKLLRSAGDP
jgi:hypothetical protein